MQSITPKRQNCTDCGNISDSLLYRKRKSDPRGRYLCKECTRWANIEMNYGISKAAYLLMYQAQNGACAICKTPEPLCSPVGPTRTRTLVVDHDHNTGRVRALLCHRCNTAVGAVDENPKIAKALVGYLTKHRRAF